MMINLIRAEFVKNYSIKKILIIFLVLIVSSFGLIQIENIFGKKVIYTSDTYNDITYRKALDKANDAKTKDRNVFNEDIVEIILATKDNYKKVSRLTKDNYENMWQKQAINFYIKEVSRKFALERLKNCNHSEIDDYIVSYENPGISDFYHIVKEEYMDCLHNYKDGDYNKKLVSVKTRLTLFEEMLAENKYYLYVEYLKDNLKLSNEKGADRFLEYCDYIINNKIEDENDFRAVNAYQYVTMRDAKMELRNRQGGEFEKKLNKKILDIYDDYEKIIEYSYKKEIKHDLKFLTDEFINSGTYNNTKNYMNRGLCFGFIILLILIITESGIVAKEHETGTIKLLVTKPIKREKILVSKFIYLVLNLYLLWVLASIILFIICGLKYGFSDIFVSKLVVLNSQVLEINYLVWYFFSMIICSIPVVCFISLIFFLSTVSRSTVITASISSILSILSMLFWIFVGTFNLEFLSGLGYLPLPYLNYYSVLENNYLYLRATNYINVSKLYGLIISVVFIIILVEASAKFYKEIDITNK